MMEKWTRGRERHHQTGYLVSTPNCDKIFAPDEYQATKANVNAHTMGSDKCASVLSSVASLPSASNKEQNRQGGDRLEERKMTSPSQ